MPRAGRGVTPRHARQPAPRADPEPPTFKTFKTPTPMNKLKLLAIFLVFRSLWKRIRRAVHLAVAAAPFLLAAAGCASVDSEGRLRHKQFEVKGSGLDWLEIVYEPAPGDPRFPYPVRLSFVGSGSLEMKSGPSPLVEDSMSQDVRNPHWNDYVRETVTFTPDEMKEAFQTLVDEGLVATPSPPSPDELSTPHVQYAGTINTEKFRYRTDNARLVALVEAAMEANFGPKLRATSVFGRRR